MRVPTQGVHSHSVYSAGVTLDPESLVVSGMSPGPLEATPGWRGGGRLMSSLYGT